MYSALCSQSVWLLLTALAWPSWRSKPCSSVYITAYAVVFLQAGLAEPRTTVWRLLALAGVLALAATVFAATLPVRSAAVRAVAMSAAGTATAFVGMVGGGSIGLPLVPAGTALLIAAFVVADGSEFPRLTFLGCVAAGALVFSALVAIVLAGRGLVL